MPSKFEYVAPDTRQPKKLSFDVPAAVYERIEKYAKSKSAPVELIAAKAMEFVFPPEKEKKRGRRPQTQQQAAA